MKRKNRIDWDKELQKTERIRMNGFKLSLLGFGVAVLFLLGAGHLNEEIPVFSYAILIGCFLMATVIIVLTLKRRAVKLRKMSDEENEENKESE